MNKKHVSIRKIICASLATIILASQLMACSSATSRKLLKAMENQQHVVISTVVDDAKAESSLDPNVQWKELDKSDIHSNNGFRMNFDTLCNINVQGDSKAGCLFNKSDNGKEIHEGNAIIGDAFTNQVFIEKYWNNADNSTKFSKLAKTLYNDVDESSSIAKYAALNGYWGLFQDYIEPTEFKGEATVSREEFYTMVCKATNRVRELNDVKDFDKITGSNSNFDKYAQEVEKSAWLNTTDKSLSVGNLKGSITNAEAIYMLMNIMMPNELKEMEDNDKDINVSGIKNGDDLASKIGFKGEESKKEKNVAKAIENNPSNGWKEYVLEYSIKNKNNGVQKELYDAYGAAQKAGIDIDASNFGNSMSRNESMDLLLQVYSAINKRDGYATKNEYGEINNKIENGEKNGLDLKLKAEIDELAKTTARNKGYEPFKQSIVDVIIGEGKYNDAQLVAGANYIDSAYKSIDKASRQVVDSKSYGYFYNQLNKQEQAYYNILISKTDRMTSGLFKLDITSIVTNKQWDSLRYNQEKWNTVTVWNHIFTAERAFYFDQPEVFYLDTNKFYYESYYTYDNIIYHANVIPRRSYKNYLQNGFSSSKDVNICLAKFQKQVQNIVTQARKEKTAYNQIRVVHDYLVDHVTYDNSKKKNLIHTSYGAIVNNLAVCNGYSFAFKVIMDELKIPCVIINGNDGDKQNGHTWNYVQLDGKWYGMDVTWDDEDIPDENINDKYNYFLRGRNNFGHKAYEIDSFGTDCRLLKYPQLNNEDPQERIIDSKLREQKQLKNSLDSQLNVTNSEYKYIVFLSFIVKILIKNTILHLFI